MGDSEEDWSGDDEDYMSEDEEDEEDGGFLDEPAVHRQETSFQVLDQAACLSLAEKEVSETSELLCCDRETAALMLRMYRWDREKLMEVCSLFLDCSRPRAHTTLKHRRT